MPQILHSFVYGTLQMAAIILSNAMIFGILYNLKIPALENLRSRTDPDEVWPWESMEPEKWK